MSGSIVISFGLAYLVLAEDRRAGVCDVEVWLKQKVYNLAVKGNWLTRK